MSSPVILKVPTGLKWKVDIVRCEAEIWLQKGWEEFAEYYSVVDGSLLVFEYVKSISEFNVFIFDKSSTEIDYPFSLSNGERHNLDQEQVLQDPNVVADEQESDVSVEILPSKAKLDDQFQNRQTCDKTLNQNGEAQGSNVKQSKEKESSSKEPKLNDSNTTRLVNVSIIRDKKTAESQVPEFDGTRTGIPGEISRKRKEKSPLSSSRPHKIIGKGTNAEEKEEHQSLQKKRVNEMVTTSNCQSEIPAFEVKMQLSYVHDCRSYLEIPGSFATKYMRMKDGDALLSVLDGRTWSIKFKCYTKTRSCGQTSTRLLHSGWNEFPWDNHLQVGDVCNFALIDPHKTQFRVVISRCTMGANAEPEKQKEKALTREEKAMVVQRAVSNFRSENPSFDLSECKSGNTVSSLQDSLFFINLFSVRRYLLH